ncbi:MAG: SPFH/Band 7/PHB domain protein [Alphaproteobacteria bacterium]|nr:SPFH/Band 7/PHB domain protein [Alphaproteobacteria bacterium]
MSTVILFLLGIIIGGVASAVKIVPQSKKYIVERLGKYKCTWDAGLHVMVPLLDRVVNKVSLKEQVFDFPPQPMITHDNVIVSIDFVVFCRVFDPKLFSYGVENAILGMQNISATTLRNLVGELELDQLLTSRESVNKKLEAILDEATDPWGIKVSRVEIKQIILSKELEAVMSSQMRAERERRQTVLEAKAHQEAVVSRAEGDKKAKILAAEAEKASQIALAEGKAKSILLVYQAEADGLALLNSTKLSNTVLKLKGIEAMKDVANGKATKIYMSSDLTNTVSHFGLMSDALGTTKCNSNEQ